MMFEMTPWEKRFFNDAFDDMPVTGFKADVKDLGDRYLLEADLPGFQKSDIKIDIHDHRLTIKAERHAQTTEDNGKYVRQERTFGTFTRAFDISDIDETAIQASYEDGVLKLTLPKIKEQVPVSHQIEIQ